MSREKEISESVGYLMQKTREMDNATQKIFEIFSTGVKVKTGPEKKEVVATKETINTLYSEYVDKPLHELTRKGAVEHLQKMYALSRGVTPDEIKALGADPSSEMARSAITKMEGIRQDFTDIVTSEDLTKIAGMYRGITRYLRDQDISFLGKMQDMKGITEHAADCLLYTGGQSFFEQTFNYGNEKGYTKIFQDAVGKIDELLKEDGTSFDEMSSKMKAVQVMSQTLTGITVADVNKIKKDELSGSVIGKAAIIEMTSQKFEGADKFDDIEDAEDLAKLGLTAIGVGPLMITKRGDKVDELLGDIMGDKKAIPFMRFSEKTFDLFSVIEREDNEFNDVFQMSKKEFSERLKGKVIAGKTFSKAEVTRYLRNDELISSDDKQWINEAENGDFSHFEKMSVVSRNMLASKYIMQNQSIFDSSADRAMKIIENRERDRGTNEIQNPLLRLGVSLEMRSDDPQAAKESKKLDSKLNEAVMKKTLMAPSTAAVQRLQQAQPDTYQSALERNAKNQKIMGKTMLMAQLGQMTMKTGEEDKFWKGSVVNAFSHCSRVAVSLPAGSAAQDPILHSLLGEEPGRDASVVEKRGAATHSVELSTIAEGLEMEEKKGTCFSHQYGMNVAIGGIGNIGIGGPNQTTPRPLLNDGSCGHMYMHIRKGDDAHYGGMLIGFESDAAGITNQMGHTHDIMATPEKASSFGGQRTDEIGNKYGGRSIDLRSLTKEDLVTVFNAYDEKIQGAAEQNMDLSGFYGKLCGQAMNPEQLANFLENDLSISHEKVAGILSRCTVSELSEKNMKDLAVLYDNSKNYMNAKGINVEPRIISDDKVALYQNAIQGMENAEEKAAAQQLLNVYRGQNTIGNQQKEIGARMRVIKETSSLVKDPTTPIRVKKYAMQQERICTAAQKEAYITSDKAEDYLKQLCGMEPRKINTRQAMEFATNKTALPVPDIRAKALSGAKIVTTKDDYDQLASKMSTSKRSFLGIKLGSSDSYQSVQHELDKIQRLHEVPVDRESLENISTSYETLGAACQQYIADHKNPRTDEGKNRLAMVKEVLDKQKAVDFEKYQDPAEFAKIEGKQWKAVDYKKTPAVRRMNLNDLREEEMHAQTPNTVPKNRAQGERLHQNFSKKKAHLTERREETAEQPPKERGIVPTPVNRQK